MTIRYAMQIFIYKKLDTRSDISWPVTNNIGTTSSSVNPTQILPNVTGLGCGRIKLKKIDL